MWVNTSILRIGPQDWAAHQARTEDSTPSGGSERQDPPARLNALVVVHRIRTVENDLPTYFARTERGRVAGCRMRPLRAATLQTRRILQPPRPVADSWSQAHLRLSACRTPCRRWSPASRDEYGRRRRSCRLPDSSAICTRHTSSTPASTSPP